MKFRFGRKHPAVNTLSWQLVTGLVGYLTALFSSTLFADPDTLWHLAAGKWMVSNGRIPLTDPFSFTRLGEPWVAHEWLSELLMASLYAIGGWPTLQVIVALIFAGTLASITRYLSSHLEPVNVLTAVALSWVLLTSHLLARPHVFVWPLMTWWCISLVRAVDSRTAPPYWLLAVLLLWVNLHGSFILGIGLMVLFAFEAVVGAENWSARRHFATLWMPRVGAAFAVALINPNGWRAYQHVLEVMGMTVTLSFVSEWRSTDFHQPQALLLWLLLLLLLGFSGRLRVTIPRALTLFVMLYLALKHERYHSLFGLTVPLFIGAQLGRGLQAQKPTASGGASAPDHWFRKLAQPMRPIIGTGVWGGVLLVTVLSVSLWRSEPNASVTPSKALAFADSAGLTGNVFNHYNFGGYLIYKGVPVFIDGRADMYGDEFVRTVRDAYWLSAPDSLPHLLHRHGITWTLLRPDTPATQFLDVYPGWARVYSDSVAVIHARRM